jgi:CheY-like chemotaxis protein
MKEPARARGPHILLVEDNPGDVLLVKESFRAMGNPCRISVAGDGQAAMDFLYGLPPFEGATRPDLILLDLNLPKINGMDVLAHIKANVDLQEIPVLILSSSQAPADIQKAYALAANCYLCKPNGIDELFQMMRVVQDFWLRLVQFPRGPLISGG